VRRHETDVTSLVFGLIFLGLAAMWPLVHYDAIGWPGLGVLAPLLLVAVGLVGLVTSIRGGRRPQPVEGTVEESDVLDETALFDRTGDIDEALAEERQKANGSSESAPPA